MEPNYVGANKHMDAMAVAWLFAGDYFFFNPDEITWDGKHHGIAGVQINIAMADEIPTFMENPQMYCQGICDMLMSLEQDEELIVPRGKIHPGLHDAIREGDLTGITLFNLQACARAFQFLEGGNEQVKRGMLQTAGLAELADNPDAMACTHVIMVDQRLTRGIPGFYRLVRRMFEDMRAYNEIDLPYVLLFVASRNIDADQCLDSFDDSVEGAISESFHVETNMEEWKAEHGIGDDEPPADAVEDDEANDDCSTTIAVLKLYVATAELSGGFQFPQDILDELERAENGDESVDVDDLARRMHELAPDYTEFNPLDWTYEEGLRAEGPAFSVAIPDGFDVHENIEVGISNNRPFVAVVKGTDEGAIGGSDQIVYVDHGLMGVLADEKTMSMLREWGTVDLLACLQRMGAVESYDYGVRIVDERLVPCINGKCLVTLRKNLSACEFYITPLMFNSSSWLKVGISECAEDAGKYMDAICELASKVELAEPAVSELVAKAHSYKDSRASVTEIVETFEALCNPMLLARQKELEAMHQMFLKENPMHTIEGEAFAQARALTRWGDENLDVLELLVDVYAAQKRLGMPVEEQDELNTYLSTDFCTLFKMNLGSEGDPWDVKAKEAGVLRLPEGFADIKKRWEAMKPGEEPVEAPKPENAAIGVAGGTPKQEAPRRRKAIREAHKTAAIPRIEKALREKVTSDYFIETSEIAANELMAARQAACDAVVSDAKSDEDNVANMAKEFSQFNSIICRYYGYLVDALEAQVEFGNAPGEIKKMAAEVEEFSVLIADRFSCGDAYLDEVANWRAPVERPARFKGIHARWQKVAAR